MVRHFEAHTVEADGTPVVVVRAVEESIFSRDKIQECVRELEAVDPSSRIVLDLSNLDLVGSAFVGVLVKLHKTVQNAGGCLCVCGSSQSLVYVVGVLRLDRMVQMVDTEADAIAAVTAGSAVSLGEPVPSP